MATVELSFTPLPAHVRTARLVATAVARRSGVEESLLDEVRLAVGEACSRAVEAHRLLCPAEPVRIELSDQDGRFEVVVTDAVPGGVDDAAAIHAPAKAGVAVPAGSAGPAASAASAASAVLAPSPTARVAGGLRAGAAPARERGTASAGAGAGGTAAGGLAPSGQAGDVAGGDVAAIAAGGDVAARNPAVGPVSTGGTANGTLPVGIGLAVIAGLADDVQISATSDGVSIRMSWPLRDPA
jgi:serine/threonine-protein kinase RsbW